MNLVLNWVKSNVYTVIFVLVMIAAPVALWIVSGKMNVSVREEVEKRAAKISELGRLEKTSVSFSSPVPGNEPVQATIAVNRQFLDRYEQVVSQIREDADRVKEIVLDINQKDREVLLPKLFPQPPMEEIETLPREMYNVLTRAYARLLDDVGAGTPPSIETMADELEAARERYKTQFLVKEAREELTDEEREWLTEQLTKTRLSLYADAARSIKFYADLQSLDVPFEAEIPISAQGESLSLMFDWQWRYWIQQDILKAVAAANEPYSSVVDAPVKRLVSVLVLDEPGAAAAAAPSAGGGGPPGGFGTAGAGGRRKSSDRSGGDGGAAARPADAGREVPLDFSASFTGRQTNPLFDVRRVEVVLIVDSARIPEIFDAISRENFMTILDVRLEPVDLFEAIGSGYFYGSVPVSQITLELETIWVREWTSPFMPPPLREALGVPEPRDKKKG